MHMFCYFPWWSSLPYSPGLGPCKCCGPVVATLAAAVCVSASLYENKNGCIGANICQRICWLSHKFIHLQETICKRPQRCEHLSKKYVNFLTSFWTGRRFSAILLNQVFVLYVFYHVLRSAPYPADRRTDAQLKASGLSLLASQFVWE